jgi:hypothetical protein
MAIIELGTDSVDVGIEPDIEPAPTEAVLESAVARPPAAARLTERLGGRWPGVLTLAWIGIFTTGVILEPTPADPDAALPLIEGVLVSGLLLSWIVMAAGFATRRRYGVLASLAAAVCLFGLTIACQASGHHAAAAAWWWFEVAGSTALVGLSTRALRTP